MNQLPWYLREPVLDALFDLLPARYVGPVLLAIAAADPHLGTLGVLFRSADLRKNHWRNPKVRNLCTFPKKREGGKV